MGDFRTPGHFCWLDIKTPEPEITKRFYGALLGWHFKAEPLPDRTYTKIHLGQDEFGGLTHLKPPMFPAEIPPHISTYVAVVNADQMADRVTALGGTVLLAPFDAADLGRMATIQDPTGAVLSLWQAKTLRGMRTDHSSAGAPGWFELTTTDMARSAAFYAELFNWTVEIRDTTPLSYAIFQQGGEPVGGMKGITSMTPPTYSEWGVYFTAKEGEAKPAAAQALGAQILVASQPMPGVGRFTRFTSPDGITCNIIDNGGI